MGQSNMWPSPLHRSEGRHGLKKVSLLAKKCLQQTRLLGSRKLLSLAKVGDELTLSIHITGAGTWSILKAPELSACGVFLQKHGSCERKRFGQSVGGACLCGQALSCLFELQHRFLDLISCPG